MNGRRRNTTNAEIWGKKNSSNYDGNCTARHCLSGTYEISRRWIFVRLSVQWTARVCFTCSLPLTLFTQNVMRIGVFCHAWISRPASYSVEPLPRVAKGTRCKPLHDVRLCDNTGLFVLRQSYFCFSSTTYFLRNASPEIKFCSLSVKIL